MFEDMLLYKPSPQELLTCMKTCDTNLLALSKLLEDMRGVNIDIIENIDPNEKDLIVY